MPNCGKFICNDDFITFEDIESDEKCIGIEMDKCITCKNVRSIYKENTVNFLNNPSKLLFYEDIGVDRLEELWNDLTKICGIEHIITEKEQITFMSPDLSDAEKNFYKISESLDKKYIPNLQSLIDIIRLSPKISIDIININDEVGKQSLNRDLKNDMSNIMIKGNWSCSLIHNPLELPYVLGLILQKLANNKNAIYTFKKYIDNNPSACVEAELQRLLEKL